MALARKVAREFAGCNYVVAPSGSCAGMMRTHYPDLLKDIHEAERDGVRALAEGNYELTDFLVNIMHYQVKSKTSIKTITYHDSCSGLRELGVKQQPRTLLAQVEGAQLREMDECEQCCGFGGASALKFGEILSHIADRKCGNIAVRGVWP